MLYIFLVINKSNQLVNFILFSFGAGASTCLGATTEIGEHSIYRRRGGARSSLVLFLFLSDRSQAHYSASALCGV